jgi:hypothetical protein
VAFGATQPIFHVDRTGEVDDEIYQLVAKATTAKLR